MQTQLAKNFASLTLELICHDQKQISSFPTGLFHDLLKMLRRVEFVDGRLEAPVFIPLHVNKTSSAEVRFLNKLRQGIQLLATEGGTSLCQDSGDESVSFDDAVEDTEISSRNRFIQFHDFCTKTKVGFICPILRHGLRVWHPDKVWQIHIDHLLKDVFGKSFKHVQHIGLVHEGHLTVDLGKLRLTVSAEIFIPETLDNLKVSVHPCHHQQLLQDLRRLRKRVEVSRLQSGRHQKVSRTFRR